MKKQHPGATKTEPPGKKTNYIFTQEKGLVHDSDSEKSALLSLQ